MGPHQRVLSERCPMNTNGIGFRRFSNFFCVNYDVTRRLHDIKNYKFFIYEYTHDIMNYFKKNEKS